MDMSEIKRFEVQQTGKASVQWKRDAAVAVGVSVALLSTGAYAAVDYAGIVTAISTEVTAAITAGIALVGLITGAKVGVRFLKSVFAK